MTLAAQFLLREKHTGLPWPKISVVISCTFYNNHTVFEATGKWKTGQTLLMAVIMPLLCSLLCQCICVMIVTLCQLNCTWSHETGELNNLIFSICNYNVLKSSIWNWFTLQVKSKRLEYPTTQNVIWKNCCNTVVLNQSCFRFVSLLSSSVFV